jgi:hypothetical protein
MNATLSMNSILVMAHIFKDQSPDVPIKFRFWKRQTTGNTTIKSIITVEYKFSDGRRVAWDTMSFSRAESMLGMPGLAVADLKVLDKVKLIGWDSEAAFLADTIQDVSGRVSELCDCKEAEADIWGNQCTRKAIYKISSERGLCAAPGVNEFGKLVLLHDARGVTMNVGVVITNSVRLNVTGCKAPVF